MNKLVIYTAIFGNKDTLNEDQYPVPGADYICFTDNPNVKSSTWDVRHVPLKFGCPIKSAREYKILPHKYLSQYNTSIWIDGNFIVISDLRPLTEYSKDADLVAMDHDDPALFDRRDCVYEELKALIKYRKADPDTMRSQVTGYREEGYPEHNGLSVTGMLIRRHNDERVIEFMEDWWKEVSTKSIRDQLSLNYVEWKGGYDIYTIPGDIRNNKWTYMKNHNDANWYRR